MEEKRAFLALALSAIIIFGWMWLFPPRPKPEPPPGETTAEQTLTDPGPSDRENTSIDADRRVPSGDAAAVDDPATEATEDSSYESVSAVGEETVTVGNDLFEMSLSNRGASATSFVLHGMSTTGEQLELLPEFVDAASMRMLAIELDDPRLADQINDGLFTHRREMLPPEEGRGAGTRVWFEWSDGAGLEVSKVFTVWEEDWLVDVDLAVLDRGRRMPAMLVVGPGFGAQEAHAGTYYYGTGGRRAAQVLYDVSGTVSRVAGKKTAKNPGLVTQPVRWAGLEDQYFAALVLPAQSSGRSAATVAWRGVERIYNPPATLVEPEEVAEPTAPANEPLVAVFVPEEGGRLFIGPKRYDLLETLGSGLEGAVWFSSYGFLSWISRMIFFVLLWIHSNLPALGYGLAIVLCTALLRIVLFPLNQYSMVQMKRTQQQMQRLQPKMKAIKSKYKKVKDAQSRAKMNQEMMDLYKREGVNPAGGVMGCLPMLAQFPILIGFYQMLTVAFELRGAPFLYISDLSSADPIWLMPILMGVTMFLQQRMSLTKSTDPQLQQQQRIMQFMPFVFTYFCFFMPAGLVLYWFVNNLLGIGQQWLVNRQAGGPGGSLRTATQKA